MPIFLCIGGKFDSSNIFLPVMISKRRYAQRRLQSSLAFPLDFIIEDSCLEMAIVDIPDIKSAFTSRNNAFNGELCIF